MRTAFLPPPPTSPAPIGGAMLHTVQRPLKQTKQLNGDSSGTSGRRGMDTLERRTAPGASHNSGERFKPSTCSMTVRNAIINYTMDWVDDDMAKGPAMMWLYGPAAAGKSSICQTIAQICHGRGLLAASFFFSKNAPGRNNEKHLMATLAYQISLSIPETRALIAHAVESDPHIFSSSLEVQLQALIVNPLVHAWEVAERNPNRKWPSLILIDGLDQCHGANIQRYIVRILSTALIQRKLPLHVLVSSKPEPAIRDSFNSYDLRDIICTLVLDDNYLNDAEIKRYLWVKFDHIKQTHPLRTYIPSSWPPSPTINSLIKRSTGQYVYASTVVRYVDSSQHRPVERLEAVLRISNRLGDLPFAEVDCLYRHIFAAVHNLKTVLRVLGAIFFAQKLFSKRSVLVGAEIVIPVSDPRFLEELLSLNRGDVFFLLSDLHAILSVPDPRRSSAPGTNPRVGESGIKVLHGSLQEFLTDRYRAGKYFINSVKQHAELARSCAKNLHTGHKYVHQYAGQAFVHHCRNSVLTNELLNDLLSFDLSTWLKTCKTWGEGGGPFDQAWTDLPLFFQWLRSQTYSDPQKDLHEHHMRAWEDYLRTELAVYQAHEQLGDLLAFVTYPRSLWEWTHVWPLLGVSYDVSVDLQRKDREALHVTGLKQPFDVYRGMLSSFLLDSRRSGDFRPSSHRYASVALKLARYLFEPKKPGKLYPYKLPAEWTWFREDYDDKLFREKKTKETFQAGIQYLPYMLSKAAMDDELLEYVKTHKLDKVRSEELPKEAWAVDKVEVEKAVAAYIERCANSANGPTAPSPESLSPDTTNGHRSRSASDGMEEGDLSG